MSTPLYHLRKHFNFRPNFSRECRECGARPTVIVEGHAVSQTDLCGPHFFADRLMVDWQLWNEQEEATE